ncbi:hypothetical protein [Curtobacterium sp. Leaf261]|uniref:hypothetical protein n=1 Tax=Curtobacterium sp. Leaf261 TaxID=1736311 RepID=UPI0006FB1072|nr:hypothetical protein [Curtobacterium sp. Leaf261]KQO62705.1 hypothetical protein ASF23_06990 [Curtobacterium sp. Leaf261]
MASRGIAAESLSVVVLGQFNPAVFSPLWFFDELLIGRSEREQAEMGVVSNEVTSFQMGWLRLTANTSMLQLSTTEPEEFVRLRDAVIGTLRALTGTPVAAVGINHDVHVTMDSIHSYNRIGHVLAPKSPWDGVLQSPGMRSVILWGARPDDHVGRVQIRVEPSQQFPQSVYIQNNDHYQFTATQASELEGSWQITEIGPPSSQHVESVINVLQANWDASLARATVAESRVVELGGEEAL